MWKRGFFIVIDGIDGSGKATQTKELVSYLRKEGYRIAKFDFPRYEKPSSYFVRKYLNGRYGDLLKVGPYKASLFYALDRFDAREEIEAALREGRVVISNRYVASNMGHQGARIKNPQVRKQFFYWLQHLEFDIFEVPRPDATILLHVPAKVAQKLVDKKRERKYLHGKKRDIHEASLKHLRAAERVYRDLKAFDPHHFRLVSCVRRGKLLSIPEIQGEIRTIAEEILKEKKDSSRKG